MIDNGSKEEDLPNSRPPIIDLINQKSRGKGR
jgi:hypothetical protein